MNKKGFTLIELLLVLAIFSIIMGMVITALTSYNRKSKTQNEILMLEEDIKPAIYMLTNYIQMAGFGTNYTINYLNGNVNGFNRVFTPNDSYSDGSDRLTVVLANRFIGYVVDDNVSDSSSCYQSNKIYIKVENTSKINLIDSNLKRYIFIDRCVYNSYFELTSEPSSINLPNCSSGYCYQITLNSQMQVCDNDSVYAVRAVTFDYDSTNQEIEMNENIGGNNLPIIANVETIQFQYGIDKNNDGNFDDIDNDGDPLDNTFSKSDEKYLKLVKVYILIRTKNPDPDYKDSQTTYHIANKTIRLDTNDSNGINSKYDWHYRRKLIVLNIIPRNVIYGY